MKTLIVVTGGRNYSNRDNVRMALGMSEWREGNPIEDVMVLSGGATGLDSMVLDWAFDACVNAIRMPAQWDRHGRKAGMLRNEQMIEMSRTFWRDGWCVLYIAFPGGVGTEDMTRRMKNAIWTFEDSAEGNGQNWVKFQQVYA